MIVLCSWNCFVIISNSPLFWVRVWWDYSSSSSSLLIVAFFSKSWVVSSEIRVFVCISVSTISCVSTGITSSSWTTISYTINSLGSICIPIEVVLAAFLGRGFLPCILPFLFFFLLWILSSSSNYFLNSLIISLSFPTFCFNITTLLAFFFNNLFSFFNFLICF